MPLGFERINERVSRPNALINFIKPLPGPTSPTAHDFLSRIAAQCYPIMKAHHIAVMALEEHEWNPEFIGRNFNAGEVVQLVLRSRGGAWLPFRHVQMVMMHELAHCREMNHSRAFWAVRNEYAEEMRGLWGRRYVGEGLWGRGVSLEGGRFLEVRMPDASEMPKHMCGGTYRRRGRKRKRAGDGKDTLSYAERKQRRILRKFGTGGVALGDDEETRVKLEDGKKPKGKPRVAGSNRGRELRAAAAFARFEKVKEEPIKKEETDSDTEDEYDWQPTNGDVGIDRDGKNFLRVCEAEDQDDADVKREMEELYDLAAIPEARRTVNKRDRTANNDNHSTENESLDSRDQKPHVTPERSKQHAGSASDRLAHHEADVSDTESESNAEPESTTLSSSTFTIPKATPIIRKNSNLTHQPSPALKSKRKDNHQPPSLSCHACSMANEPSAIICIACSNVLNPAVTPNHWRCGSDTCKGGVYVNIGDYGLCQLCGASRA